MTLAIRLIKQQIRGKHIHAYKEDAMLIRFFSQSAYRAQTWYHSLDKKQ